MSRKKNHAILSDLTTDHIVLNTNKLLLTTCPKVPRLFLWSYHLCAQYDGILGTTVLYNMTIALKTRSQQAGIHI